MTLDCTGEHRALAKQIDLGAPASPSPYAASCPPEGTHGVVRAVSADGRLSASIRIALSGDSKHRPLEVARANKELDFQYFSTFPDSLDPLTTDDEGALFPLFAFDSSAQGSSGVVAAMPFVWRGHAKSPTTRARPSPDLAVWLE